MIASPLFAIALLPCAPLSYPYSRYPRLIKVKKYLKNEIEKSNFGFNLFCASVSVDRLKTCQKQ